MHKIGHYGVNAILYAPFLVVISLLISPLVAGVGAFVVVAIAGLPDIDVKTPFISHRGITHTVWFAIFIGVVVGGSATVVSSGTVSPSVLFGVGFFVGAFSILGHLVGDAITPMGIKPFSPISDEKYTLSWVTSDSKLANGGLAILGMIVLSVSWSVTLVVVGDQHLSVLPNVLFSTSDIIEVLMYG